MAQAGCQYFSYNNTYRVFTNTLFSHYRVPITEQQIGAESHPFSITEKKGDQFYLRHIVAKGVASLPAEVPDFFI